MGVHSQPGFEAEDYWDGIDTGDRWPDMRYPMGRHTNDPEYCPTYDGEPVNTEDVYPTLSMPVAKALLGSLKTGVAPSAALAEAVSNALLAAISEAEELKSKS